MFQAIPIPRSPPRASAAAAARSEEAEVEPEAAGPELVSLEDAEAGEKAEPVVEDELEVEGTPADDNTFLEEEEEEDDNVAGLIDGDLDDDEEP